MKKVKILWPEKVLTYLIFIALPGVTLSQADWKNDFKYQELTKRPDLEVRYTSGDSDAL